MLPETDLLGILEDVEKVELYFGRRTSRGWVKFFER